MVSIISIPRIFPSCRYAVWLACRNTGETTNPMSKRRALQILKKELAKGKKPYLIRTYSSISAKKHDRDRDFECGKTQKKN